MKLRSRFYLTSHNTTDAINDSRVSGNALEQSLITGSTPSDPSPGLAVYYARQYTHCFVAASKISVRWLHRDSWAIVCSIIPNNDGNAFTGTLAAPNDSLYEGPYVKWRWAKGNVYDTSNNVGEDRFTKISHYMTYRKMTGTMNKGTNYSKEGSGQYNENMGDLQVAFFPERRWYWHVISDGTWDVDQNKIGSANKRIWPYITVTYYCVWYNRRKMGVTEDQS